MRRLLILIGLILWPLLSGAQPQFPSHEGYITDPGRFLSDSDTETIERVLDQFTARTGQEIAVVIVPSIGGMDANAYATAIGNRWGIGDKDRDNGVIFLIETQGQAGKRAVYIAVGAGIEGDLTDLTAKKIVEEAVIPRLARGERAAAVQAGLSSLMAVLSGQGLEMTGLSEKDEDQFSEEFLDAFLAFSFVFFSVFHVILSIPLFMGAKDRGVYLVVWGYGLASGAAMAALVYWFVSMGDAFTALILAAFFGGVASVLGVIYGMRRMEKANRLKFKSPPRGSSSGGSGGSSGSSSSSSSSSSGGGSFRGGGRGRSLVKA